MKTNALIYKTANLSLLALAAVPLISLGFARAEPAAIKLSDLNMSRPADVQTLHARIDRAANKVCVSGPDVRDLDRFDSCLKSVRAEAVDKIPAAQAQVRVAPAPLG